MKVIQQIQNNHTELTAWRRDIHAHPELGFEEGNALPNWLPIILRASVIRSKEV
ncbi:MAG: hypothetical protein CM1200mP18_20490 [Gammaproteobacteria bacterium]|nr:MAG: hypothetical protein CM1200mP18_20490 [Gammaproteobacteria bacterium]